MKKLSDNFIQNIAVRYLILVAVAIPNLWIFYFIFTPLTIYPVLFLLNLFYQAELAGNTITIAGCASIEIIKSCIAGSAYYLLLVLNLSVPKIKLNKRLKMISLSFLVLLSFNILRIFLLSLLYISGNSLFDFTHWFFWYFLSTIFVVAIWFAEVRLFKINKIPVYSDIKEILRLR